MTIYPLDKLIIIFVFIITVLSFFACVLLSISSTPLTTEMIGTLEGCKISWHVGLGGLIGFVGGKARA
jgi:hypothetical protein